jgi:hypothetical protein
MVLFFCQLIGAQPDLQLDADDTTTILLDRCAMRASLQRAEKPSRSRQQRENS